MRPHETFPVAASKVQTPVSFFGAGLAAGFLAAGLSAGFLDGGQETFPVLKSNLQAPPAAGLSSFFGANFFSAPSNVSSEQALAFWMDPGLGRPFKSLTYPSWV